jgi:3-oxoacyl-[acyl-carrier protein] reductase
MQLGLHGKCALVCAASKGLGRASARALAREGAAVAICARHSEALDTAAADIRAESAVKVVPITADVSASADIDRLVRDAAESLGGIDILVTNTGGPRSAPFEAITDDMWRAAIDSLLLSVVRLTRLVIPHMRRRAEAGSSTSRRCR